MFWGVKKQCLCINYAEICFNRNTELYFCFHQPDHPAHVIFHGIVSEEGNRIAHFPHSDTLSM